MNKFQRYLIIIFLCITVHTFAQSGEIKIVVDANFDILKTSRNMFGNSDYWPYILKYNKLKWLSQIKIGDLLFIPQAKVKKLIAAHEEAKKAIHDAVQMGAKVLAEELLESANTSFQKAIKEKNNLDYDLSIASAEESINLAKTAYKRTKEIREKTIDAIISFKKGDVQKLFPKNTYWQHAELYDNLKENDWARTLSLSLANITFHDLSQIKLNENSQAIIQSSRYDAIANNSTTKVRLEKGDAYAMLLNTPKKKFDLDIKGIKTKINSKFFWVEKEQDRTKLSNYNGEIAIQVKDSSVVVKKNQGSVVPTEGYPTKPKNLVPAPYLNAPRNLITINSSTVTCTWEKQKQAFGYWIEIAYDVRFTKIFKLIKGIKNETVDIAGLENGVYYWHVCSVDEMNLPGNYSEYRTLIIAIDKNAPYLSVQSPDDNFISLRKEITIEGVTETNCLININGNNVNCDEKGRFMYAAVLQDGYNTFEVTSTNSCGIKSAIIRNVYFETEDELKISDKYFGELKSNNQFYTRDGMAEFNLTTLPYSLIELKSLDGSTIKRIYTNSNGSNVFEVNPETDVAKYLFCVTTLAGRKKEFPIEIVTNRSYPKIVFDDEVSSYTNMEEIELKGILENTVEFFINGERINIQPDKKFSVRMRLKPKNNAISLKAISGSGITKEITKDVYYDSEPPRLISQNISNHDNNKLVYKINIRAEDASQLRKAIRFEYLDNGLHKTEIAELDDQTQNYYAYLHSVGPKKPMIKKIFLEDYLSNTRIYEVGN